MSDERQTTPSEGSDLQEQGLPAASGDRGNRVLVITALLLLIAALVAAVFLVREIAAPKVPTTMAEAEIARLEQQLRDDPANPNLYFKLADTYFGRGDYEEALGTLDELRSQEPTGGVLAQLMYGTGRVKLALGDAEGAEKELTESLEIYELADVHYFLGRLYADQGDWGRAVTSLEAYVEMRPQDAATWAKLGEAYEAMGDTAKALEAFKRAAAMLPDDAAIAESIKRLEAGN